MKQVGIAIPKVDALEKVLGSARYGADQSMDKPLHLKVVRSKKHHAKIVRLQVDEALRVPGVERVFTAKDVPGKNRIGIITKDQPVLASDRVRYIGDPVALVAARSAEAAEEAADRVKVVYEDLPFISSPEDGLKTYAPSVHENGENGNLLLEFHVIKGDVQSGFKEADVIAEKTYTTTWI
jgi:CO/xanthine dehydrogenase Mo-binding subunit